jgi:glyoxylase-like metal-dependent hydrolase (beta-lactamase superfamily II)
MTILTFPFFTAPKTDGELIDVAPGVKWLRMPLPMALNHINLYLIRDNDGWMIVDTGLATDETRGLWKKIIEEKLAGARITGVICTHFHFDHAGLAGWLTDWLRVPLYMSYGEYYTLRVMAAEMGEGVPWEHQEFFCRAGFPEEHLAEVMVIVRMARSLMTRPPASFRRLRHGERLMIGDREWHLHVGEGHAPEHMLLHCPQDNLLIAGDQLLPRITSNVGILPSEPEADQLACWFATLDNLALLPPGTFVLPAHELPYYGLATRVAQLHAHHEQQFATIRKLCATQALTAYETAVALFPVLKNRMDDLMAMGECLAHLTHLRLRGEMERTLGEDGAYRFRTLA